MLRWTSFCRIIKLGKYPRCVASTSAADAEIKPEQPEKPKVSDKERSRMVAAAFASIKDLSVTTKRKVSSLDVQIAEAANTDDLLSIADQYISKHHALKIVSKLADWAGIGKIKMSDFECDPRYARICRALGQVGSGQDLGDLSVILGVAADEQAAKLIASISLPQMVKVMNSLGVKGRRSTPILRSLSFNIGRSTEVLQLKQAADVLFACSVLNFPDEVLLAKVNADITSSLKTNKVPAVVSSIARSVGKLKYRDPELLENLCNWMVENSSLCRTKEYISLVVALGNINYVPEKFNRIYQLLKPFLKEHEMTDRQEWLDLVWSLVILQKIDEDLLTSVLNPKFISKLTSPHNDIHFATKMKLLNINGAAQQLGSRYEGSLLPENSKIFDVPLARTKEKQVFIDCIKESLSNFLDVPLYFKTDVNTKMGFLIDFECRLNSNSQPVKESKWSEGTNHKVAIVACNYHDVCRGNNEDPHGRTALYYRLLENSNYKLIVIPFYEFNPRDKLISRVQYLENKLKSCIVRS